jgi:hypothetical protein
MGMPRKLAAKLLRAAIRLAPPQSREWAAAMLRELDFIEGDWAALFWALGSFGAIFRHAATEWRAYFTNQENKEDQMNETGKKAIGFMSGLLGAFVVVLCALGVQLLAEYLFPTLKVAYRTMTHVTTVMVIPEAIFIAVAVKLWPKRGAVAAGVLFFAVAAGLHVFIYFARR